MKKVCVYCGSSPGRQPAYLESARSLGVELARRGIGLVYGGASIGMMGEIADAVLRHGGEVTGIIPQALMDKEVSHHGLTELKVVKSMHERKATMADLSDGFIALPGGLGTVEELFEILTWSQLGFHAKPSGLLNVIGYYDLLSKFLNHSVEEKFVHELHRQLLIIEKQPEILLDAMEVYQAPKVDKWIGRPDT
jgi:uncharacterized protein (TIGR00730 family)